MGLCVPVLLQGVVITKVDVFTQFRMVTTQDVVVGREIGIPHPKCSRCLNAHANRRSGESGFRSNPIVDVVKVARYAVRLVHGWISNLGCIIGTS